MNAVDTVGVDPIVTGPLAANCYVVSSPGGDAVVVDPGGDAEAIAEHVEAKDLHPHAVLATHGHYDHVGALAEVVERYGVPFGIHSAEADSLKRVNFCRSVFHGLGRVAIPDVDLDLARVPELSFGDLELAVVHTPGHSPGSVCFEVAGMLLTGDTLMATHLGAADMPGSDPATLEDSARRLARDYPLDTVIHPGHGAPGRLGTAIAGRAPSSEPRA